MAQHADIDPNHQEFNGIWKRPLRKTGWVGFLTTVDHKKIGIGYALGALFLLYEVALQWSGDRRPATMRDES